MAAAEKCSLCTSAFAHEEAVRNIQKKAPEKLADLTVLMKQVTILPEPHPKWVTWAVGLPLAPKDAPVLAAALQGRSLFLSPATIAISATCLDRFWKE